MPTRRSTITPLAGKLTELWLATPQVMGMRLSRMAMAGHKPSAKDRAEMHRMSNEKVTAFYQSWMAMSMNMWLMPLKLAPVFAGALGGGGRSRGALQQAMTRASTGLLSAGLAPVHRTAVANAKRLGRRR